MILRDVLVSVDQVGSDGFEATVGRPVVLALELTRWSGGPAEVTGRVLPLVSDFFGDSWVLDAGGFLIYVSDDTGEPLPEPATRVRVHGSLSLAPGYVVDSFGVDGRRECTVRRIQRFRGTATADVTSIRRRDGMGMANHLGFLLDLEFTGADRPAAG